MKVSCIVPTYNRSDLLMTSIVMFLKQTYPYKEMIIIDDSNLLLHQIADICKKHENIKYIHLKNRRTIGYKRNLAVSLSTGKYIAFWDDDDIHGIRRLEHQVNRMKTTRCDATTCGRHVYYHRATQKYYIPNEEIISSLWWKGLLMPSVMFKKSLWERFSKFPHVSMSEDRIFFERIQQKKTTNVRIDCWMNNPRSDFIYVMHGGNTWSTFENHIISVTKPYSKHCLSSR